MNKEQQIEEMQRIICKDCATTTKKEMCELPNEKCDSRFYAELFYNAGYRKTFTSDLASDTQKAYKQGYRKGLADGKEEFEIIKNRNAELIKERDRVKAEYEKPIDKFIKDREAKAVKKFAEWVKDHIADVPFCNQKAYNIFCDMVNEKLKECEK